MTILRAGVARRVITPPTGIFLIGYGNRVQGNIGVHDDLFVTTLVIEDGFQRAAILTVDIAFINTKIVAQIKSRLESQCDITSDAVFICCSHTHAGPVGYADEHSSAQDQDYIHFLIDRLVESAVDALQNIQLVTLRAGMDESKININRRERTPSGEIIIGQNPDGLVDHSIQVLQFVTMENEITATVVNYACHPVVMGPSNRMVSADWVGAMRQTVEQQITGLCLFIQSTTADLNPHKMRWTADSWDEVEAQGNDVGAAVIRASEKTDALKVGAIKAQQSTQWLKLLPPTGYNEQIHAFLPPNLTDDEIHAAIHHEMPWFTELDQHDDGLYSPMNVGVLRVGDWALATIEAEPFVETGLKIKAGSPAGVTFVAGYTNGCNTYLPVASAYADGGYEVETAPLFYGLPAPFAPGCAEQITEAILKLF
jgi:neutral ceramidase